VSTQRILQQPIRRRNACVDGNLIGEVLRSVDSWPEELSRYMRCNHALSRFTLSVFYGAACSVSLRSRKKNKDNPWEEVMQLITDHVTDEEAVRTNL